MALSVNQIKENALKFVKRWQDKRAKDGKLTERQNDREFMGDFYDIFGISKVSYRNGFEYRLPVNSKRIDSLLPGVLLIEMESEGVDIKHNQKAGMIQASEYAYNLHDKERPEWILACNFVSFYLHKPGTNEYYETTLDNLVKDIEMFMFLAGYEARFQAHQTQVNKEAAESISLVYQSALDSGVPQNAASLLMTRLVFALFADDTQIFPQSGMFQEYLLNTREDGDDLLTSLLTLFSILNTPKDKRVNAEIWQKWPYINGGLFEASISPFTSDRGFKMTAEGRNAILKASEMDWSQISPIIFGSMFEGALDPKKRHDLGAHFTSESNILKIIDSLFMDDLREEFNEIKEFGKGQRANQKLNKLQVFQNKLRQLKFLDPASGSGNFLILAYRELRTLEHDVLEEIVETERGNNPVWQMPYDFIEENIKVEVSQFYGIEIQPFAVSIARVGMWLIDHLMNLAASEKFGNLYVRLPLHLGANIVNADSLKVDWLNVWEHPETWLRNQESTKMVPMDHLDYILGNPPFIGQTVMNKSQKETLTSAIPYVKKSGKLDFVAGWYLKTAQLMQTNPKVKAAFVSTNSIAQGEQAIIMGQQMFNMGIHYNFAHQTFKWDNNGAAVFVIIIGFSKQNAKNKWLFTYKDIRGTAQKNKVKDLNEYLLPTSPVFLNSQNKSISNLPKMAFGTMPRDGGNLILTPEERLQLIKIIPNIDEYIHPFIGAKELLHNNERYILYLKNAPAKITSKKAIYIRLQAVHNFRTNSKASSTRNWANRPTELVQDQTSNNNKLVVPRVSSERREYVPMGYYDASVIPSDAVFQIEDATLALFAILQSKLHVSWLKTVAGRLKGDFRYSNTMVYNTFVIPKLTDYQIEDLNQSGQAILSSRSNDDLSSQYDPLLMSHALRKSHASNDKLVDSIYGLVNPTDTERVATLLKLYKQQVKKNS